MTDNNSNDKYIKCSRCRCKYINDDEHIDQDFGYSRLGERFKNCVKCRDTNKQHIKVYNSQRQARRDKTLSQETDVNHQTCTHCLKIKQVSEFTENDKQFKYCTSCRNNKNEKRNSIRNRTTDDSHQTCTLCLHVKQVTYFTENGKQFKCCNVCRNTPKQQLITLKEALVGGSTQTCKLCQINKQVNQFQRNRETNTMRKTCNPCCQMIFDNYTIERQKRLTLLAQESNNDDSEYNSLNK